jgi:hypothetical protein
MPATITSNAESSALNSNSKLDNKKSNLLASIQARTLLRKELRREPQPLVDQVRLICRENIGRIPEELRSEVWQILLDVDIQNRFKVDDLIRETKQDLENQRVIRVDAERTRYDTL